MYKCVNIKIHETPLPRLFNFKKTKKKINISAEIKIDSKLSKKKNQLIISNSCQIIFVVRNIDVLSSVISKMCKN
jgi:hypothetical protein